MDILTPVLIGIGLSMDCLAVSLAIGMKTKSRLASAAVIIALFFAAFQAGMTLLGWAAGTGVTGIFSAYGPLLAFLLLAIVGGKMILEGLSEEDEDEAGMDSLQLMPVIILSFATSIDALAVGVGFGLLNSPILVPALVIGIVCFILSAGGVIFGRQLAGILGHRTEILGGIILILIGLNILLGHPLW